MRSAADRATSRLAGAPISWGVCEAPGWGVQLPSARVLAELRDAGLAATELGPVGYLPDDPDALAALLHDARLTLVGGFLPVALHDAGHRARAEVALDALLDRVTGAGGDVVALALVGERGDFATREQLDAAGWRSALAALDALEERARRRGVTLALHPHAGTVVEREQDVRRVLDGCSIGLCIDTGHLAIGGCDPAALVRAATARVAHVHLKDVDAAVARRWRAGAFASYRDAVAAELYRPLGEGDAGVEEVVRLLADHGYRGWFVLECDTVLDVEPPAGEAGPLREVRRDAAWARALLAQATAEAGKTAGAGGAAGGGGPA